jgi:hypothetical protein
LANLHGLWTQAISSLNPNVCAVNITRDAVEEGGHFKGMVFVTYSSTEMAATFARFFHRVGKDKCFRSASSSSIRLNSDVYLVNTHACGGWYGEEFVRTGTGVDEFDS